MSKAEPGRDRVCAVGAESTRCAFREWRMPLDLLLTYTRNLRFSGDSRRLPPLYTLNLKCQSCRPSLAKLGQQRRHLPRLSDQSYYEGFGAVLVTGQYTSQGSRTDCMRAQMSRQKKRVLTHYDQATQTESKKPKPPPAFVCSITQEVMQDPVMNECGMTFERDAIERWMRRSKTCPLTNMKLSTSLTIPNIALRHAIEHWMSLSDSGWLAA